MTTQQDLIYAIQQNNIELVKNIILSGANLDYSMSLLYAVKQSDYIIFDYIIQNTNAHLNLNNSFTISHFIYNKNKKKFNNLLSISNNEYFIKNNLLQHYLSFSSKNYPYLFDKIIKEKRNKVSIFFLAEVLFDNNCNTINNDLNLIFENFFDDNIKLLSNSELLMLSKAFISYRVFYYFKKIETYISHDYNKQLQSLISYSIEHNSTEIFNYLIKKYYISFSTSNNLISLAIKYSFCSAINYILEDPKFDLSFNNNALYLHISDNIKRKGYEELYIKIIKKTNINPLAKNCEGISNIITNKYEHLLPLLIKHPYVTLFNRDDITNNLKPQEVDIFLLMSNIIDF